MHFSWFYNVQILSVRIPNKGDPVFLHREYGRLMDTVDIQEKETWLKKKCSIWASENRSGHLQHNRHSGENYCNVWVTHTMTGIRISGTGP